MFAIVSGLIPAEVSPGVRSRTRVRETRLCLWSGWITLGLRLAPPTSPHHVLGWEVRRTRPDLLLLGARSRIGMPAELLLRRYENAILFDTFVQQNSPAARAAWAATEPIHRRVLPAILGQFRRRQTCPGSDSRREPA